MAKRNAHGFLIDERTSIKKMNDDDDDDDDNDNEGVLVPHTHAHARSIWSVWPVWLCCSTEKPATAED